MASSKTTTINCGATAPRHGLKHYCRDLNSLGDKAHNLSIGRIILLASGLIQAVAGPAVVGLVNPPRSHAQASLAFEVASVKLSKSQEREMGSTGNPPILHGKLGVLNYFHVQLKGVVARAYNVWPAEVAGPSWLDSTFYDIVARAPQGATAEQAPAMLQKLLAERFRMQVHWDTKQEAGYALVAGKTGVKLKRSGSDTNESVGFTMGGPDRHLEFKKTTLEDFARSLTIDMGRPVADMTGIQGIYDIVLDCSADSVPGLNGLNTSIEPGSAPSIFVAIRALGLDLVSQRVPVRRLVVDSAEKIPTEN